LGSVRVGELLPRMAAALSAAHPEPGVVLAADSVLAPPYEGFAEIVPRDRSPYPVVPGARLFQRLLNALGADLKVDGKPGPGTRPAVAAFQSRHPEAGRADGVIDAATARAILSEFQRRNASRFGLSVTGVLDPATSAALLRVEAAQRMRAVDLTNGLRSFTAE